MALPAGRAKSMLLTASAALLAVGGVMHTRAFGRAAAAVASSSLPDFYGRAFKALWLIDSATLLALATTFGLLAARPEQASRGVVVLLSVIPAATAAMLYTFIGRFLPAHVLLVAALMAGLAGMLGRRSP
jgi:hypothetical protein